MRKYFWESRLVHSFSILHVEIKGNCEVPFIQTVLILLSWLYPPWLHPPCMLCPPRSLSCQAPPGELVSNHGDQHQEMGEEYWSFLVQAAGGGTLWPRRRVLFSLRIDDLRWLLLVTSHIAIDCYKGRSRVQYRWMDGGDWDTVAGTATLEWWMETETEPLCPLLAGGYCGYLILFIGASTLVVPY